jgi:hypothetical protein
MTRLTRLRTHRVRGAPRTNADSPLIPRDVEVGAQRPPDIPRVHAILDRLRGRAPTETGKHVVDEHRRAAHRAELSLDQFIEFRQPHVAQPT